MASKASPTPGSVGGGAHLGSISSARGNLGHMVVTGRRLDAPGVTSGNFPKRTDPVSPGMNFPESARRLCNQESKIRTAPDLRNLAFLKRFCISLTSYLFPGIGPCLTVNPFYCLEIDGPAYESWTNFRSNRSQVVKRAWCPTPQRAVGGSSGRGLPERSTLGKNCRRDRPTCLEHSKKAMH
ncbi:hypothetical protein AVEN_64464-1 [Araneus ventricosus]|uniref:Uncharacterized protein n=1 Tax=Araneus ventricosus TaxID=182803 RepID=A0A4Y2P4V9_ARAVE|nr:hypothetical protein AVEN_64464-1 [Araneus ventricosus]